jgi:hypothetical protein
MDADVIDTFTAGSFPRPYNDHTRSKAAIWTGRILHGLMVLFLAFDVIGKLLVLAPVIEATTHLGFPASTIFPIGVIGLACLVLYVIPRTAVIGAILWTGYLGGAIASNLRASEPVFSHTLAPIYFAVILWGELWLRDPRVSALFAKTK